MTKKQFIKNLKEGEEVNDVFFVKFKKGLKNYKNKKGLYFDLTISDNTGNIDYKYWGGVNEEQVKQLYQSIKPDSVIKIKGKVTKFNNKLQLSSNENEQLIVLTKDEYDVKDFIKQPRKDVNEMINQLKKTINEVSNEKIKQLLNNIFNQELIKEFAEKPGGIEIHHNWVSGLLEHTLEVLKYSLLSAELFPTLNKDLIIAGSLLHDIGKIDELTITTRLKGTIKGQLIGHIILGAIMVSNKCDEINMPDEIKNKILHIITSHHGHKEFGSPKEPMMPEALAVYYADEASSKLAEITEFVNKMINETEDEFMYNKRAGRNFLLR